MLIPAILLTYQPNFDILDLRRVTAMKQFPNPSFEKACVEALTKARQINDVPKIVEAVNRASMLIALTPEKAEEIFREKMQEGYKL